MGFFNAHSSYLLRLAICLFCTFLYLSCTLMGLFVPFCTSIPILANLCNLWQQFATNSNNMSSNIRVNKICQYCGKEFEAKKTTSKTCSDNCAKMYYKARQRAAKVEAVIVETKQIKLKPIEDLKAKEFLSITDACELLGISRWSIWRSIKRNDIKALKIGKRTLIKRSEIDKLFA